VNEAKDTPESEANEQSLEEGVVCTACLEVNPPYTDYCSRCGAPLNSLVAFNPFDQTLVEGFAYRRAVDGPPSKIILIGMWLSFGPALLAAPLVIATDYQSNPALGLLGFIAEHIFWLIYFLISAAILYRTTTNYFAKRHNHL
jgi:hypothetical protein